MAELPTIGVAEAAALLRMSEDALMRKARAGIVPGGKGGRRWLFVASDLIALIREQAKARACRSIATLRVPTGGSDSRLAESRLDDRLRQLTEAPRRNSRPSFALISCGRSSSESDPDTPSPRRSSTGTPSAIPGAGRTITRD